MTFVEINNIINSGQNDVHVKSKILFSFPFYSDHKWRRCIINLLIVISSIIKKLSHPSYNLHKFNYYCITFNAI